MDHLKSQRSNPFDTPFDYLADSKPLDDWEDWEDDDHVTVIDDGDNALIDLIESKPSKPVTKSARISQPRVSTARQSIQLLSRLKSRRRQKAQNAKAGIRLETDMSKFRQAHIASQMKPGSESKEARRGKFVDAAALKALEGEPSTSTVGSFHWLKRKPSPLSKGKSPLPKTIRTPVEQDLSPDDRPIVIGFALPEGSHPVISPQTAIVQTPDEFGHGGSAHQLPLPTTTTALATQQQQHQRSVWSPDTEDGISPFRPSTATLSAYSRQSTGSRQENVPPVPLLPWSLKETRRTTIITDEDDDAGTPVTLFEEDGSPVATRKSPVTKVVTHLSPATAIRGWWDEVTSPFSTQTPLTASPETASPVHRRASGAWRDVQEKNPLDLQAVPDASSVASTEASSGRKAPEVVSDFSSPTVASSSRTVQGSRQPEAQSEKAWVLADEAQHPSEEPPPYSPPSRREMVRYRAVFPPGHPLNTLYPPSPRPVSPGLAGTMTSQGAVTMTDVPLTPPPQGIGSRPLPDRTVGSFVTGDHFFQVTGRGPRQKAERQRQRHEKEDAMARKVGSLWKGRGCLPANGCYGRLGREGRKRRRICFGIVAGVIGLIILIAVLATTLSHGGGHGAIQSTEWLNLTAFPPIPTGVLTVVGPDNSQAVTACVQPSTLWSCSLPKEQANTVDPYQPTQPKFTFQIQFDNSSSQSWNNTGEVTPRAGGSRQGRRNSAASARALTSRVLETRSDSKFTPNPGPPSFKEMWFMGNTTDGIKSDQKAGEPTPFYISLLRSANDSAGPNALDRRGIYNTSNFPAPELEPDGTGGPARLFPLPYQQPLRLYDRGLPTEHYGFYSYYDKSIYVKSKAPLNKSTASQGEVPADLDGGALETEANFLVVWGQTRFKVEIWTRMESTTQLVGGGQLGSNSTRPGTFPYPVTVTLDNHGGNGKLKGIVAYAIDDRQRVDTTHLSDDNVILYNLGFNGPWINPPAKADPSLGGIDGGTGGCQCEYTNFIVQNGR